MHWLKWVTIAAALAVIGSCFFPWVIVESRDIVITGIDARGTNYGKPGYMNLLFTGMFFVFSLIPRLWASRINVFLATLNFAWSLRNFIILPRCEGGECPEMKMALIIVFIGSIVMLLGTVFTPVATREDS